MKKFENDLTGLQKRVVEMWNLTEVMVTLATGALLKRSGDVSPQVLSYEDELDKLQLDIDHEAVRLLTVYSPVAADLRYILSVSHVNSSLERIGDEAVNLCEHLRLLASRLNGRPQPKLAQMAKVVRSMVHDAMASFIAKDVASARATMAQDDLVDALYDQVIRDLLSDEFIRNMVAERRDMAGALAHMLIARSLERMADHACNICEQVIYRVSGDDIRHAALQHA